MIVIQIDTFLYLKKNSLLLYLYLQEVYYDQMTLKKERDSKKESKSSKSRRAKLKGEKKKSENRKEVLVYEKKGENK